MGPTQKKALLKSAEVVEEVVEEAPTAEELVDDNTRDELDAMALALDPTYDDADYDVKADVASFIVANR